MRFVKKKKKNTKYQNNTQIRNENNSRGNFTI